LIFGEEGGFFFTEGEERVGEKEEMNKKALNSHLVIIAKVALNVFSQVNWLILIVELIGWGGLLRS
jgi:hypothetical protein